MEPSAELGNPLPKYCSVATALEVPAWAHTTPPWHLSFACPFALQAPWLTWHNPLTRCASYQPCPPIADPAWQRPRCLGRVGDAGDTWVLARRGPDGFYYRAQIKTAPELERQGALLVEFEAPLVTGPELPAPKQNVVLGEDVIQFSPPMEHSLQPGDKVLAPWEPARQRYGPATVLGLEARGPRRASKGEITVHFWNGRTAAVPAARARRVSPAVWRKAVERLRRPFTGGPPSAPLWASCCPLLGPGPGCVTSGLPPGTPLLCLPCPHTCCQLLCQGCPGYCPSAGPTWWPLTRTSGVTAGEHGEAEPKAAAPPLPPEAPEEGAAVQAPGAVSPAASEEGASEEDPRPAGGSTGHAGPRPAARTRRRRGALRPPGRCCGSAGPEPPGKPGKRCCDIQKEEKGHKQQREPMAVVGSTKELVLETVNMKPLQALPERAEHGKLSQGTTATRQRHRDALD